jgi:hypothetical protein
VSTSDVVRPGVVGRLGLIREDCSAGDGLTGRDGVEIGDQREDEARDPAEEALVVSEEYPKSFGHGEDELPAGQGEKQLLVEVLGEEKGPLLATGLTQVKPATRERAEVLVAACRIRTSDAGDALSVVSASEEARGHSGDPFQPEVAHLLCVAGIVLGRESPEVVAQYLLEDVRPVLYVGKGRGAGRNGNRQHASGNDGEWYCAWLCPWDCLLRRRYPMRERAKGCEVVRA